MSIICDQIYAPYRSYHGVSVNEQKCRSHLQSTVKDNLLDREERQNTLDTLKVFMQAKTSVQIFKI